MFSKKVMSKLVVLALAAITFDEAFKAGDTTAEVSTKADATKADASKAASNPDDQVWETLELAKEQYKQTLIDCIDAAEKAIATADAAKEIIGKELDRKNGGFSTKNRKEAGKKTFRELDDISWFLGLLIDELKGLYGPVSIDFIERRNYCVTKVAEALGVVNVAIEGTKVAEENLEKEKKKCILALQRKIPAMQFKITLEEPRLGNYDRKKEKSTFVQLNPEEIIAQVLGSAKPEQKFDEIKLFEKAVVPGIVYGLMFAAALALGRFIGQVNEKYSIAVPSKTL